MKIQPIGWSHRENITRCPGIFGAKKTALWNCILSTECQKGPILSWKSPQNESVTKIRPCQKIKWGLHFEFFGPKINFPGNLSVLALRENYFFITSFDTFPHILFFDKVSNIGKWIFSYIKYRKKKICMNFYQNMFFRSLLIIPGQN